MLGTVAARVPAERTLAGDPGLHLDRGPHVLALGVGVHVLVIESSASRGSRSPSSPRASRPPPPVALERHCDPVHGDRHAERREQAVEAPEPGPAAVFVEGLHVHVAPAGERAGAHDVGQERLRRGVAVEDAALRPFLVVDDDLHRNAGIVRPPGIRWIAAVSAHVSRVGVVHRRVTPLHGSPGTAAAGGGNLAALSGAVMVHTRRWPIARTVHRAVTWDGTAGLAAARPSTHPAPRGGRPPGGSSQPRGPGEPHPGRAGFAHGPSRIKPRLCP